MSDSPILRQPRSRPRSPRGYGSFTDFYRATYQTSISQTHATAIPGVNLIDLDQGAGDWSDAPHPDLVVAQIQCRELKVTANLGDGIVGDHFRGSSGMIVQPPNVHASIYIDNPHRFRVLTIPYQKLLELDGDGSLPRDGNFGAMLGRAFANAELFALVDALRVEAQVGNPRGALYTQGGLIMLGATLAQLARMPFSGTAGRKTVAPRGGLTPRVLKRVTDYLMTHLAEDVALADLAVIAGLSPHHFCRAFKQSTGLPPHAWLTQRRIERAQDMMVAHPSMGLPEIALCVGYQSQTAFGAAFKRVTGDTPSRWRRGI